MLFSTRDPFEALRNFQRGLDAARSSDWFGTGTTSGGAFPPVNVFRKGDDFVLVAEMPGVDKSKIDIQVKHNQVRLRGTKNIHAGDGVSVHRRERAVGDFDRVLGLPAEVDADKVKAEYKDGLLTVFLPRPESDKPRSVSIE
ncbi:MAG: Hsp20/alpha crystallin family protein [Gammaproteobacteria bacterium]|nr:Hsp20/alpha crystallin family protein [Gammaproteobacteria bacterium]